MDQLELRSYESICCQALRSKHKHYLNGLVQVSQIQGSILRRTDRK